MAVAVYRRHKKPLEQALADRLVDMGMGVVLARGGASGFGQYAAGLNIAMHIRELRCADSQVRAVRSDGSL